MYLLQKKHPVTDYSTLKFDNTERKHIKTCEKPNAASVKYNTVQDLTLPEGIKLLPTFGITSTSFEVMTVLAEYNY